VNETPFAAINQPLQMALYFHGQSQLENARKLYLTVLELQPSNFQALYLLGMLESQSGDLERAAERFQQSVDANPQSVDALNNLGYTLQRLGQDTKAQATFEQALSIKADDQDVLNNLGLLHKRLGETDAALACFDQILEASPKHIAALCNKGNLLQQMGQPLAALECYDQALGNSPGNAVVLCNRSNALQDLMRNDEALESADLAIKQAPRHAQAWVERGNALTALGRLAEAIESYRQAIAIDPLMVKAHTNLAGVVLSDSIETAQSVGASQASLRAYLRSTYPEARVQRAINLISAFKLKHDLQQANFLREQGQDVPGLSAFLKTGTNLMQQIVHEPEGSPIKASAREYSQLLTYLGAPWVYRMSETIPHCLNPDNDWQALEDAYLASQPEVIFIDDFLSQEALLAFQRFSHISKVWLSEYANAYLGAFANRGFNSQLHLQLARELRQRMPRVFRDYSLDQLWGFKYEPTLTKGINVHADFAKVNLNFWITPSHYNLDPESGGLKVYTVPAPEDWTFQQYNCESALIYDYLAQNHSGCITIPHRCNRALLFNSALFHETDTIRFAEGYESRRVNMTYLFGKQLR